MSDEVRRAWAYLSRVAEPPCPDLAALVSAHGPVEAANMVRSGNVDPKLRRWVDARREVDCAAQDLEVLDRLGGRLITPEDDEWPRLAFDPLDRLAKRTGRAPLVLWAVGPVRLDDAVERAAALVGTRAATAYGEHVTGEFAAGLVERDVTVVSGGAYGVDGAAHRAALASEGITVAVVAVVSTIRIPPGTARCSGGSARTVCSSASIRPVSRRDGYVSSRATGWSPRCRGRLWWWRPGCVAVRPTPRRGRG
ncbi:DNA protecting protein DprA [Mycolicibacterium smegmatis MC2 155]|uniref:DNA protecting protein DprA n=1 Tax=Mycolicibacterium smegmatis (strain ATCC 700084 / mc(2)155) TaxID=246196 RepID=I7FJK4_MYCS2|nr:DNA protecting protein DprA [Mycolicibacterium smegmatis MC2 155]